jgi:prepilin-type processing-associated H-X9-DG protein
VLLKPNDPYAYWALGYLEYFKNNRAVFACPSAVHVDEWHDDQRYFPVDFWRNSTYGVCKYLLVPYEGNLEPAIKKVTWYQTPSKMIFCQDAAEQNMDNNAGGDTIAIFPGESSILAQWIGSGPANGGAYGGLSTAYYFGYHFDNEWYRHGRGNQTVWVDGHVSRIKFTGFKVGIDYRHYTGITPLTPVPN